MRDMEPLRVRIVVVPRRGDDPWVLLTSLPAGFGAALGRTVTLDLGALDPKARKTPYSDQITVGVAREIQSDLALNVDYTYLRGRDLFRTVDLNGPAAFAVSRAMRPRLRRTSVLVFMRKPQGKARARRARDDVGHAMRWIFNGLVNRAARRVTKT